MPRSVNQNGARRVAARLPQSQPGDETKDFIRMKHLRSGLHDQGIPFAPVPTPPKIRYRPDVEKALDLCVCALHGTSICCKY